MSKNGNLLLNVPPKADGSFDSRVVATLHEIGDWLSQNGQAIFQTKPWSICCEGPAATLPTNSLDVQNKWPIYAPGDFRFTTTESAIFVFAFGWSDQYRIRSLNSSATQGKAITDVTIVGVDSSQIELGWEVTEAGLDVTLPKQKPAALAHAWVMRMHLDGAGAKQIDAATEELRRRILL